MDISLYIKNIYQILPSLKAFQYPWEITKNIETIINDLIKTLNLNDYHANGNVLIHKSAIIENNVTLKGPIIIGENCFIGANAYLRGGVFLDKNVKIGPSTEIKSSFIFSNSAIAHLSYVGDSLIGTGVNIEAGAVFANHFNEREDKEISVKIDDEIIKTGVDKFGSLVGDNCRIGANAVISPGSILKPNQIVGRLELF